MAKSNSFFGLRRGSTKAHTYSVLKGQQITKDRVYGGANPRTKAQMTQRSQFLSAVRFFQRANQNLFRFAFESKRQNESEYNAFMRANAKLGGYITKAQGDAAAFPMVAPFILAQGSLPAPTYGINLVLTDSSNNLQWVIATGKEESEVPGTIGEVSALILASNPSYRAGDIVTAVSLYSSVTGEFYNDLDAEQIAASSDLVEWKVFQFFLDTADTRAISTTGLSIAFSEGKVVLYRGIAPANTIVGGAFIVSRNTSNGVKVSTSSVALSTTSMDAYEAMRSENHLDLVVNWWGAQQDAILQGSIAKNA